VTTVLLAEDNEMNRDMLGRRLRRKGYEVVEAHDGEMAVSYVKKTMPDIVLMDLSMPVLDGLEATAMLREDDATRDIPIIALTAHAIRADRDRALEAGCDDVITKPFEFQELLDAIEHHIGGHDG
jgi:CheY-like chemotaxis protein